MDTNENTHAEAPQSEPRLEKLRGLLGQRTTIGAGVAAKAVAAGRSDLPRDGERALPVGAVSRGSSEISLRWLNTMAALAAAAQTSKWIP